jgi:tetratricopeptide (TPR) repeat protein
MNALKIALISSCMVIAPTVSAFAFDGQTSNKHQLLSSTLVVDAERALSTNKIDDAKLLFERALVANPSNIRALIGLGKTHELKGLTGRGLTYYRLALEVEPNDQDALEAQSLAFLKKNLYDRAEANRDRLKQVCSNGCTQLDAVENALKVYREDDIADKQIADAGESTGDQ